MIEPTWRRIAGIHFEEDGTAGAVWLAHDMTSSVVHCYDAAKFSKEVIAIIAEGLGARGRHFPVAWRKQDAALVKKLEEAGINMLYDPCEDSQAVTEAISREIQQRMRSSRFRVDKRVGDWLKEFQTFYKNDAKVPMAGYPLMAATRHAIEMLSWAEAERMPRTKRNGMKIAIL